MIPPMLSLMMKADMEGIRQLLEANPALANEGLPLDEKCQTPAHPLHRLCDGVFNHVITEEQAVGMARLLLSFGAKVDGVDPEELQDTPLLAASSLHADQVALLLIDAGANIHHRGCDGATALHWAAWTGRDVVVRRLIEAKADIHLRDKSHNSTPLLWAVHGYKFGGGGNRYHQPECVRLLRAAGADPQTPNIEGTPPAGFLEETDEEMLQLLR